MESSSLGPPSVICFWNLAWHFHFLSFQRRYSADLLHRLKWFMRKVPTTFKHYTKSHPVFKERRHVHEFSVCKGSGRAVSVPLYEGLQEGCGFVLALDGVEAYKSTKMTNQSSQPRWLCSLHTPSMPGRTKAYCNIFTLWEASRRPSSRLSRLCITSNSPVREGESSSSFLLLPLCC